MRLYRSSSSCSSQPSSSRSQTSISCMVDFLNGRVRLHLLRWCSSRVMLVPGKEAYNPPNCSGLDFGSESLGGRDLGREAKLAYITANNGHVCSFTRPPNWQVSSKHILPPGPGPGVSKNKTCPDLGFLASCHCHCINHSRSWVPKCDAMTNIAPGNVLPGAKPGTNFARCIMHVWCKAGE